MLWRCGIRLLQLQPKHAHKRSLCGHLRIDHDFPHWPKSVLSKIVHALHDRSVWPRRNSGSKWTTLITDSCGLLIVPTVVWQAMGRCLRLLGGGARRVLGVQQDSLPHANQHTHLRGEHGRCSPSASTLMTTNSRPSFALFFMYASVTSSYGPVVNIVVLHPRCTQQSASLATSVVWSFKQLAEE